MILNTPFGDFDTDNRKHHRPAEEAIMTDLQSYLTTGQEIETRKTDAVTGGQKGAKLAQLGALDPATLYHLAEVAGSGAEKYDAHNFMKGYNYSLGYDAAQRHLLKFWMGENVDPESKQLHLMHAAWHCLALAGFVIRGTGTDDRPPVLTVPQSAVVGATKAVKPLQLKPAYGGGEAGVGDTLVVSSPDRNRHLEGYQKISALPDDLTFQVEGDYGIYRRMDYDFSTLPGVEVEVGKRYRFTSRRNPKLLLRGEDSHRVTEIKGSTFNVEGSSGWYLDLWKAEPVDEPEPEETPTVQAGKLYRLKKKPGRTTLSDGIHKVVWASTNGQVFEVEDTVLLRHVNNYELVEEVKVGDRLKSVEEYEDMPVGTKFSDSPSNNWRWERKETGEFVNPSPIASYGYRKLTAEELHSYSGMKIVELPA